MAAQVPDSASHPVEYGVIQKAMRKLTVAEYIVQCLVFRPTLVCIPSSPLVQCLVLPVSIHCAVTVTVPITRLRVGVLRPTLVSLLAFALRRAGSAESKFEFECDQEKKGGREKW